MGKITIGELSKRIDRSVSTIKNWYEWAEANDRLEDLPPMYRDLDEKRTRYFDELDIDDFIIFRDNIKYGMMADVNREKWGKRSPK